MLNPRAISISLLSLLLAACGPSPVTVIPEPPVDTTPAPSNPTLPTPPTEPTPPTAPPVIVIPAPQKVSLGVYDLQLIEPDVQLPVVQDDNLKFEQIGFGTVKFEGIPATWFISTSFRVTNLSQHTINHLTLLPVSTASVDGTTAATIGSSPFKRLHNRDGSDASQIANKLEVGQAGVEDQYPVTVRPDPYASLFVQDINTTGLQIQAPDGLKVTDVHTGGWLLDKALAPGESAVVKLGTSISLSDLGQTTLPDYSISLVAVDDPAPQQNTFKVKVDLSHSLKGEPYSFPNWRPTGEALYIIPRYGDALRMVSLSHLESDGTAVFNLPSKSAVTPFLTSADGPIDESCIASPATADFTGVSSLSTAFTLAENFTQFSGLDLDFDVQTTGTTTLKSGLVYLDHDVVGTTEYTCHFPVANGDRHYKYTYAAKAGWNISQSNIDQSGPMGEYRITVSPLKSDTTWTIRPTGIGGSQPPRY